MLNPGVHFYFSEGNLSVEMFLASQEKQIKKQRLLQSQRFDCDCDQWNHVCRLHFKYKKKTIYKNIERDEKEK